MPYIGRGLRHRKQKDPLGERINPCDVLHPSVRFSELLTVSGAEFDREHFRRDSIPWSGVHCFRSDTGFRRSFRCEW